MTVFHLLPSLSPNAAESAWQQTIAEEMLATLPALRLGLKHCSTRMNSQLAGEPPQSNSDNFAADLCAASAYCTKWRAILQNLDAWLARQTGDERLREASSMRSAAWCQAATALLLALPPLEQVAELRQQHATLLRGQAHGTAASLASDLLKLTSVVVHICLLLEPKGAGVDNESVLALNVTACRAVHIFIVGGRSSSSSGGGGNRSGGGGGSGDIPHFPPLKEALQHILPPLNLCAQLASRIPAQNAEAAVQRQAICAAVVEALCAAVAAGNGTCWQREEADEYLLAFVAAHGPAALAIAPHVVATMHALFSGMPQASIVCTAIITAHCDLLLPNPLLSC